MEPKRGRGRPRREGADDEILTVAAAMLRELGYGTLTVDAVAERAGVAKTTVYRRWPTKSALVLAAIAPASLAENAEEIVRETAELLRLVTPPDIEVLTAILAPRQETLRALVGEAEANRRLGALVVEVLVTGSRGHGVRYGATS